MNTSRRTLVFGKTGQVARSLAPFFPEAVFLDRAAADFERPQSLVARLNEYKPGLVINAAAYTAVDKAEIEPGRAQLINSDSPFEIADWCRENGASLIHYSTDYVYRGDGNQPWREDSATEPLNRYGRSKLNGENAILASGCHFVILRTSWVFSPFGSNFVKTMWRLMHERDSISLVNDQIGSPTYAPDLAVATSKIIRHASFAETSGIFNISNSGWTSWHQFAVTIFGELKARSIPLRTSELREISADDFPTPARRPSNSRMNQNKINSQFGIQLRPWQNAVGDCLEVLAGPTSRIE